MAFEVEIERLGQMDFVTTCQSGDGACRVARQSKRAWLCHFGLLVFYWRDFKGKHFYLLIALLDPTATLQYTPPTEPATG